MNILRGDYVKKDYPIPDSGPCEHQVGNSIISYVGRPVRNRTIGKASALIGEGHEQSICVGPMVHRSEASVYPARLELSERASELSHFV